jgi:tctex1 domain-containing protein 2
MEELGYGGPLRQVSYENTHISEPEGYGPGTKFERHKVYDVLHTELKARLDGQEYDPVKSSQISKMLADELREKVSTAGLAQALQIAVAPAHLPGGAGSNMC